MNIFMEGENDEAIHFRDEDLVTLKAQLEEMIDTTKGPIPVINIGARSLKALLARMEAAENPDRQKEHHHGVMQARLNTCLRCKADEAWRKACG